MGTNRRMRSLQEHPKNRMRSLQRRPKYGMWLVAAATVVAVAGCGNNSEGKHLTTIVPATPAVAVPSHEPPAGETVSTGDAIAALAVDSATDTVAVLGTPGAGVIATTGTQVQLRNAAHPDQLTRTVTLPGAANSIAPGAPGEFVLGAANAVYRLHQPSGEVTTVAVDGDVACVAALPGGELAAGTKSGTVILIGADNKVRGTIVGLASVDQLALSGDTLIALDRHQTMLVQIDVADKSIGTALRAGGGVLNMIADQQGRLLATSAGDNELLVFTKDPMLLRQRFPVPDAPYALAYDPRDALAWVAASGANTVSGFDLSTGTPIEKQHFATVAQPNSIAVGADGALLIGSATGAGLQRIAVR